ncbi:MAG: fumarylacetoacetate hydrolase family protein [Bacillota bacterium]
MYFAAYLEQGEEKTGVLGPEKTTVIELCKMGFSNAGSLLDFIPHCDEQRLSKIKSCLADESFCRENAVDMSSIKLLAPLPELRRNVICLGLNYREHIQEVTGVTNKQLQEPDAPIYFGKMAARVTGHGEEILSHPGVTKELDYEVELAVIIGKDGTNIPGEKAEEHIFGYSIFNDITARDLQRVHKQWIRGKSLDSFSVMGPYIVHRSQIPFPVELDIASRINGELRQSSNTRHLIFDIPYIISDLSRGFTLKAGDVIATGTPKGVGMGFDPPRYLNSGDIVECTIERIGTLINPIK